MKLSELRKKLKEGATLELRGAEANYGIMSVWAILQIDGDFYRIDSQCNDLLHPDNSNPDGIFNHKRVPSNVDYRLNFPGYGGTYAAKMEIEYRFSHGNYDAQRRLNVFNIIAKEIEKRNLHYKYPDCEMSQIVGALIGLGVMVDNSYEGIFCADWHRARRERMRMVEDDLNLVVNG